MRFTTAWVRESSQNVTLRVVVLTLGCCSICLGGAATKLALREPLVIERTCYSSARVNADPKRTPEEVNAFLAEALIERFNSDAIPKDSYLSADEMKFRSQEQADLKKHDMSQKVVLNLPAKIDGSTVAVDTDRLISVGKIRSAFSFPLTVTLSKTTRTESNPYGLLIEKITLPAPRSSSDEGKGN